MNRIELEHILNAHKMWLNHGDGGCRANLREADLSGANLSGANLSGANLSGANLSEADLSRADLREADLSGANLSGADLSEADLSEANLSRANLSRANLSEADLYRAGLREVDLSGANLSGANLCRADLCKADLSESDLSGAILSRAKSVNTVKWGIHTIGYAMVCPETGAYIGYKKAHGLIVELLIPAEAKRSSATNRKCRASKATVISITNVDGSQAGSQVVSNYDPTFTYVVGKEIEIPDFDTNRWNEWAPGIHHFITREEAVLC